MRFDNLGEFIRFLEDKHELIRIKATVNSHLEIAEITDRISKTKDGGKALLFESVQGSSIPVLINAFGSWNRTAYALGVSKFEDIPAKVNAFTSPEALKNKGIMAKLAFAGELVKLSQIQPKIIDQSKAPCQEVILKGNDVDLTQIPILQCWPNDASKFITLPTVITKDPETGIRNLGVYRMQVLDKKTTAMHWQTQKDGSVHTNLSKSKNQKLPVSVALGADPATVFSGIVPLPYGVDELLFSGFMRQKRVNLVKCITNDLEVPAEAEIVLEGFVDPEDLRVEGPFGDHTGVYTPPEKFPAFHITCITMRKKPVYITTIVGKPPMEDYYMGKAIERTFLPILKKQIPELVDMNFPMEGTFNNAVIISLDKQYPHQAKKVAHAIWGLGQLAYTKVIIIVDKNVDVHNVSEVTLNVFNNIDPKRDVFFVEGPVDTLNHASPERDYGSKMGIDATTKLKEEGYTRQWPEEIVMDEATKTKVDECWKEYGIGSRE